MKISRTYSLRDGESYINEFKFNEWQDIVAAIDALDAISCLSKVSAEKTMRGKLLFSPREINRKLKTPLHKNGWAEKSQNGKNLYKEPRIYFGKNRFREMDGIKNKVGLEIQLGKYAFMGYDIFSKMIIFKNQQKIECGIEIVPSGKLSRMMSTGVSSFEQLLVDIEHRGESNIDIPVVVVGIEMTDDEESRAEVALCRHQISHTDQHELGAASTEENSKPGPK